MPFVKNIFWGIVFIAITGCSSNSSKKGRVFIDESSDHYTLHRNGKPFTIKGAAGYSNLDVLSAAGGNTIRVWDTVNIDAILQQANKNHLAVVVGLPMPESDFSQFYDDTVKARQRYRTIKTFVNKHKNNPAVLMWCVGNELGFPYKFKAKSFYKAFNDIVEMIHHDDPHHPVTTTLAGLRTTELFNVKISTDIDVISFNIFGELSEFVQRYKYYKWLWNGPYLLTEWGVNGPWEQKTKTAWEAPIEPTSNQKARLIASRYKMMMDFNDPKYMGSFVFYWGQKQETTPTWFSIFDEKNTKTEVVDAAQYTWTGKWPNYQAPQIQALLINQKKGESNIFLKPGEGINAEIVLHKPNTTISHIEWKILKEDWFKHNNINNTKKPTPLLVKAGYASLKSGFTAPKKEGPYRLFAYIYDNHGYVATCNVPFYVLEDTK